MTHTGTNFLSICGPVKLDNKLFALKIQLWISHKIAGVDIPIPKGEKR
jgi:hypothetical protein